MNWWKIQKTALVDSFESRNRAIRSTQRLEELSDYLDYASDLILMTGRGARQMVAEIRQNKTLSTYPDVVDVLRQADQVALDSPWKFAVFCRAAVNSINDIVADLKEQKEEWSTGDATKLVKGIVDE